VTADGAGGEASLALAPPDAIDSGKASERVKSNEAWKAW
jgi:hypothetical protein